MGLTQAQSEVMTLMRSGAAFEAIEDRIAKIPDLDDDQRAALWLYAWSFMERGEQRDLAQRYLLHVRSG